MRSMIFGIKNCFMFFNIKFFVEDLSLVKLIKTKRIASRARGTYRESEAAVYEIQ